MRIAMPVWVCLVGAVAGVWARGAEYLVHNAAEIMAAQSSAKPGDAIVMADGVWTNQSITFSDTGTAGAPITLRAQTPGRVILKGTSKVTISGDYLVVDGLRFQEGTLSGGNIVSFTSSSSFSRLTNSAIIDYDAAGSDGYHWVHVDGVQNRIDHNFIKGHKNDGVTIEVSPAVGSRHRIDHNHIVDRPAGSGNGFETIRLGVSGVQTRSAQATVESNLFERLDGELEIISVKTSNDVICNNTIRASAGTITLRHGQGSRVEGNYILGENKSGTGGIRVIGPNQVVVNNYMADLDTNALSITTGYSDWSFPETATGYEPVDHALIAHNTVVNVSDQVVTRDAGYSSSSTSTRNVRPKDVTMANNLFWSTGETIVQGTEGPGWTWTGNILFGASAGKTGPGVLAVDPRMVRDAYGIWRPGGNSPAINAAQAPGTWAPLTADIDGQSRVNPRDIGADEVSGTGPVTNAPLYGGEVGPSWLNRRTRDPGKFPVPVIVMEAEDFTYRRTPGAGGATWNVVPNGGASGGAIVKATPGARTDSPNIGETVLEYDVAVYDAGTYYLYALARGLDSGSNSLYSPVTLGDEPTVSETLSEAGQWQWVLLSTYTVAAADVNRPLTLKIGRREGNAEVDALVLSPAPLTLAVPEPVSTGCAGAAMLALSRRKRRPARWHDSARLFA